MLSTTDLQTIKAGVLADATALADWNAGNTGVLLAYLNSTPSSGAVAVTRKDVSNTELFHALVATEVLALTAGQLAMLQMAGLAGVIDFTNANVAAGLPNLFASTTQTYKNILAIAQRAATRLEALFTSNGICSQYGVQLDLPTLQQAMKS